MRLFTVGHSNLFTENLIQCLKQNGVGVVVDVRSKPFSRYNPQFNRYVIAEDLQEARISYVWMGHSLGGMPEDKALHTNGKIDYEKIRTSSQYQGALEELLGGMEKNRSLGGVAP